MQKITYKNIKSVLIAEDNPDIRMLLQIKTEALGFTCKIVNNGQKAIELLKTETFDLLITDFRMPIVDGVELLNHCRQNGIHIPVIFISTEADLVTKEQIALADCCATLMYKPINNAVFLAAIGAADNRSHHLHCIHHRNSPI